MAIETLAQKEFWLQQQLNGAAALFALTLLCVVLKLTTTAIRVRKRHQLFTADIWQDALIISSLLAFFAMCICAMVNSRAYKAWYASDAKAEKLQNWVIIYKSVYGFSVVYPIASVLPKLSLCLLYLRLFKINQWFRRITYGLSAFLVVNAISWLVPSIFVCKPISASWDPTGHRGRCLDTAVLGTWISLPNILSDVVMLVLPIPILWKLSMSWLKRLGLMFTFAAASVGVVGACLRLSFYIDANYVTKMANNVTMRTNALSVIVTYLECGMYLIAATLPSMRIVFKELRIVVSSGLSGLFKRGQGGGSYPADPDSSDSSPAGGARQQLDVKLTGIGALDTLKLKGNAIGV